MSVLPSFSTARLITCQRTCDRPDLLDLEHPAGSDPGPGAQRIKPEIDRGKLLLGHEAPSCTRGADSPHAGSVARGGAPDSPADNWPTADRIPSPEARPGPGRHNRPNPVRQNCATPDTWKVPAQVANNLTRDEARDRRQLLEVISYQVELDLTGGEETFGSASTVRFRCASPGAASFIELTAPAVREIVLNGTPVPPTAFDGNRIALAGLARRERAAGGGRLRLLAQRRGAAPVHRPGRRRHLPVLGPGDVRRAPDLRLLRPARPEGDLRVLGARPGRLAGAVQHGARTCAGEPRPGAGPALALPADAGDVDATSPRSWPGRTTRSAASTTASRSASTAASRWPGTWTRTRSSR